MTECLRPQKVPLMPEEFQKTSHFVQEVSEMAVHLDSSADDFDVRRDFIKDKGEWSTRYLHQQQNSYPSSSRVP